jgi:TonB family protein
MRERRRRWWAAGLLAAVVHLQVIVLVGVLVWRFGPTRADLENAASVSVSTIDDETARKILAELDREEEKAREEEERKERDSIEPPGQVVELPPRAPSERPRKARFVSEQDSSVEKETKRLGRSPGAAAPPGLLAMREPPAPSPAPSPKPSPAPAPGPPTPAPPAQPAPAPPTPQDPEGALAAERPRVEPEAGPAAPERDRAPGAQPPPSLLPTSAQLANALAGGGTLDNLADIDDGDATALNAKSWKFASFFNRVKRQVAEHWRPGIEYERRDPTGQVYGTGSWVTFLRIVLKPDGALASVIIQKTSGLEFLDDVAVEAVKRGQPYPNPPPQLVDPASGVISSKFGFYFDVGSAPRMKVFRYPTL